MMTGSELTSVYRDSYRLGIKGKLALLLEAPEFMPVYRNKNLSEQLFAALRGREVYDGKKYFDEVFNFGQVGHFYRKETVDKELDRLHAELNLRQRSSYFWRKPDDARMKELEEQIQRAHATLRQEREVHRDRIRELEQEILKANIPARILVCNDLSSFKTMRDEVLTCCLRPGHRGSHTDSTRTVYWK